MSRKQEKTNSETTAIYVLLSPSQKGFFINHSSKSSLFETYRHHIKGRRDGSQEFIQQLQSTRPCLFVMEELRGITKREAYHYMLVWAKILQDHGYKCFNDEFLIERSNELYIWNQLLYRERKATEIEKMFSCENCLVPSYRNFRCENNKQQPDEHKKEISSTEIVSKDKKTGRREKIIRIKVSADEYETILQNATENNKQVAPYIREVAQNPVIHNFDYPEIAEHTKNVAEVTTTLRQLIWSIEASNNYLPKEIDSIVEMITYVFKTENELRTELHKERIKNDNRKKRTKKSNRQKR